MLTAQIKNYFIFLILFNSNHINNGDKKKSRNFYFVSSQLEYNVKHLSKHSVVVNPGNSSLDIILNIAEDFINDPWADVSIAAKNPKLNSYKTLFSYNINFCNILGKKETGKLNFVSMWVHKIWQYGSMPESCPISKGNYNFTRLKLDKAVVFTFLPGGDYRAQLDTYFPKGSLRDSIANLTLYMSL